jgi:hypothetical protein
MADVEIENSTNGETSLSRRYLLVHSYSNIGIYADVYDVILIF